MQNERNLFQGKYILCAFIKVGSASWIKHTTFLFFHRGNTCWFQKCALAQQKGDLLHVKWFPARWEVLQCRLEHTGEGFHVWFLLGMMYRTVYWMWGISLCKRLRGCHSAAQLGCPSLLGTSGESWTTVPSCLENTVGCPLETTGCGTVLSDIVI